MMKMAFAFVMAAYCSMNAAEPAAAGTVNTFTVSDCLVTKVSISNNSLFIEFRGRWKTDAVQSSFANTERNGVSFLREAGGEQGWSKAVEAAKGALNKKATIAVRSAVWTMRGGIPMFRIPPAAVEIIVEEDREGKNSRSVRPETALSDGVFIQRALEQGIDDPAVICLPKRKDGHQRQPDRQCHIDGGKQGLTDPTPENERQNAEYHPQAIISLKTAVLPHGRVTQLETLHFRTSLEGFDFVFVHRLHNLVWFPERIFFKTGAGKPRPKCPENLRLEGLAAA